MKPWKRAVGTVPVPSASLLQWGHGDEAVEEAPPIRLTTCTLTPLQWGHGDEAVEEVPGEGRPGGSRGRFNGATAMKPWKRAGAVGSNGGAGCASMGPRR